MSHWTKTSMRISDELHWISCVGFVFFCLCYASDDEDIFSVVMLMSIAEKQCSTSCLLISIGSLASTWRPLQRMKYLFSRLRRTKYRKASDLNQIIGRWSSVSSAFVLYVAEWLMMNRTWLTSCLFLILSRAHYFLCSIHPLSHNKQFLLHIHRAFLAEYAILRIPICQTTPGV